MNQNFAPRKITESSSKLATFIGVLINLLILPGLGTVIGSIAPENSDMRRRGFYNMLFSIIPFAILPILASSWAQSEFMSAWIRAFDSPENLLNASFGLIAIYIASAIYVLFVYIWSVFDSIVQIKRVFFK